MTTDQNHLYRDSWHFLNFVSTQITIYAKSILNHDISKISNFVENKLSRKCSKFDSWSITMQIPMTAIKMYFLSPVWLDLKLCAHIMKINLSSAFHSHYVSCSTFPQFTVHTKRMHQHPSLTVVISSQSTRMLRFQILDNARFTSSATIKRRVNLSFSRHPSDPHVPQAGIRVFHELDSARRLFRFVLLITLSIQQRFQRILVIVQSAKTKDRSTPYRILIPRWLLYPRDPEYLWSCIESLIIWHLSWTFFSWALASSTLAVLCSITTNATTPLAIDVSDVVKRIRKHIFLFVRFIASTDKRPNTVSEFDTLRFDVAQHIH